jgi:hypothetical protein
LNPGDYFKITPRLFGPIMAGAARGKSNLAIATGWWAERFAREKRLRDLVHYLEEDRAPTAQRDSADREAAAFFKRMAAKNPTVQVRAASSSQH